MVYLITGDVIIRHQRLTHTAPNGPEKNSLKESLLHHYQCHVSGCHQLVGIRRHFQPHFFSLQTIKVSPKLELLSDNNVSVNREKLLMSNAKPIRINDKNIHKFYFDYSTLSKEL
jgi:hypothetical protein